MKLAALDVGSNSFHLIVVAVSPDGDTTVLARAKEMVRLGESTLRDGFIPQATFHRGIAALRSLAEVARSHQVEEILAVATSAVREASNGRDFVRTAAQETGLHIEVIEGEREAFLIYQGMRQTLDLGRRRVALFDVGGGSTEALLANGERCHFATSLKLGVLRFRDAWITSDPPTAEDLRRAHELAASILRPTTDRLSLDGFDFVAFSSGTAQALCTLQESQSATKSPTGTRRLTRQGLAEMETLLTGLPVTERGGLPGIEARRADTIVPGVIILRTILDLLGVEEAVLCDTALREGIIAERIARPHAPAPEHRPMGQTRRLCPAV